MKACGDCRMGSPIGVERVQRRDVLRNTLGALVLVLPEACSSPSSPDSPPDAGDEETGPACAPTCTDAAQVVTLSFAQYPALQNVGGSAVVQADEYTDATCGQHVLIVVQPTAGEFLAFSASCTHACCTVAFTGKQFDCPCHGSVYDLTGKNIAGPAPSPLEKLSTCSDACGVYVEIPA